MDAMLDVGDAAISIMRDATDSDARAQPPLETVDVVCDQESVETVTFMEGTASESSFTTTKRWGRVAVDEPRLWMVERCRGTRVRDGETIHRQPDLHQRGIHLHGGGRRRAESASCTPRSTPARRSSWSVRPPPRATV